MAKVKTNQGALKVGLITFTDMTTASSSILSLPQTSLSPKSWWWWFYIVVIVMHQSC